LEVPAPTVHGWALSEDILEPVWSEGPVLPSKVVDILDSDMNIDDQQDNEEDSDLDGPDSNVHSLQTKDLAVTVRDNVNSCCAVEVRGKLNKQKAEC